MHPMTSPTFLVMVGVGQGRSRKPGREQSREARGHVQRCLDPSVTVRHHEEHPALNTYTWKGDEKEEEE